MPQSRWNPFTRWFLVAIAIFLFSGLAYVGQQALTHSHAYSTVLKALWHKPIATLEKEVRRISVLHVNDGAAVSFTIPNAPD
jgi:hypothetical protein